MSKCTSIANVQREWCRIQYQKKRIIKKKVIKTTIVTGREGR
jgi:hypothetical protein